MTFLTALLGCFFLGLMAVGFVPHIKSARRFSAQWYMSAFFIVKGAVGVLRMVYWDVYRPLLNVAAGEPMHILLTAGLSANVPFNLMAATAGLLGLFALYEAIPVAERKEYNLLTAPFYPRKR